ncbi:hypothetical protein [Acerihabitans arboris]|uniref:Uncharacterized protein n=1 Tax=Acerihabitans arboris TaxID=2691583 RepID=A0A845SM77_9GAMM|nr:hypothetical protein [Acerihabitans arboris]NDL64327.1 hypothetical protein [Acerihabitans arboris]
MNIRSYLERFEKQKSPNRISLNFENAIKYNMYSVYITAPDTGEQFLFEDYQNDTILAKKWSEEEEVFKDMVQLNPDDYTADSFSGIYYYKAHEAAFSNLRDITFLKVSWYQIKVNLDNWRKARQKHQYRMESHNVKQQMDVLKAVVDLYMQANSDDPIHFVSIMTKLHSSLWFYHDNRNQMKKEVELYLSAFVSNGNLSTTDRSTYKPTGTAILTLQNSFTEQRKYYETKYIQWGMLTTAIFSFIAAAMSAYGTLHH